MKKLYKASLTLALALISMVANAQGTTVYSWEGNGVTNGDEFAAVGGTATAMGGDANVVAGAKQKNNWCFKLGKTYEVKDADGNSIKTHYVEITLDNALKGGEEIAFNTFITSEGKSAIFGIDFDGENALQYDVVDLLTANGIPTTEGKLTVPAEAAGCSKIRLFRKSGGTSVFVSKLIITSAGEAPAATSFNIEDNGDGSVNVFPTPETASWAAFAYSEDGRASFLMNFGIDESKSDAEVMGALIEYGLSSPKAGAGNYSFANFMEMFGGAEAGNYIVAVAEVDAAGNVVGDATTKTIAYVPVDEELEMNHADIDHCGTDVDMIFQNEEWYARFDVKEDPIVAGKSYSIDDLDLKYSYMRKKDAEKSQDWTKYDYQTVKFVMQENGNMDALVTVKDNENNTMTISMYYEVNDQKSIKASGEYEVIDGIVAITAKNTAGDYKLLLNIKSDDLQDFGVYTTKDITEVGNSIHTPWNKDDVKIVDVDIFAMKKGDAYNLMGTVTGEYLDAENNTMTRTYNINITVTKKTAESLEYDLGVLEVSEDEGDIKLKAQDGVHQFIGYITCATTDVPSGTYSLLSYSKYGDYNSDFGFYMNDKVEDGQVVVVNESGAISITATFKQSGNNYTIKASVSATGISNVNVNSAKAGKFMENGKVVIYKNGQKYNMAGQLVK